MTATTQTTFDAGHADMVRDARKRAGKEGGPRGAQHTPRARFRARHRFPSLPLPIPSQVHDCQLDYYGRRLATCSSDRIIKVRVAGRE